MATLKGYNGLFPDITDQVNAMCQQYISDKAPINAGVISQMKREISYNIRFGTKIALRIYEKHVCSQCDNHDLWITAGGYASYVAGHTKKHTDVDIFVKCTCPLKIETIQLGNVSVYVNRNVVSMTFNTVQYQIIQVPFNIAANQQPLTKDVLDMFAAHVLTNFDLPLCRVAIKYDFKPHKLTYCFDMSSIDYMKSDTKPSRIKKYEQRRENLLVQPPSLKSLVLFSLFKQ